MIYSLVCLARKKKRCGNVTNREIVSEREREKLERESERERNWKERMIEIVAGRKKEEKNIFQIVDHSEAVASLNL